MNNINISVSEFVALKRQQEILEKALKGYQDQIKAYMTENNLEEFVTDEGTFSYKEVITHRFQEKLFKTEMANLAEQYIHEVSSMRFNYYQVE